MLKLVGITEAVAEMEFLGHQRSPFHLNPKGWNFNNHKKYIMGTSTATQGPVSRNPLCAPTMASGFYINFCACHLSFNSRDLLVKLGSILILEGQGSHPYDQMILTKLKHRLTVQLR